MRNRTFRLRRTRHAFAAPGLVSFAALLAFSADLAAADKPQPRRLTVAAYNVQFLLDVFDDPYSSDEGHPPKPREQIELVAGAIRAMDADVVAFTELENEGTLRALVVELLGDMGYEHIVASATNSVHGQNLGVISRLPILSVTSYRHRDLRLRGSSQRWRFARDLMGVRLRVSVRRDLELFVAHFKSRRPSPGDPRSQDWRLAEAREVRRIIGRRLTSDPSAWVLLAGDLNDKPQSLTLEALVEGDAAGALIDLHRALPTARRVTYLKKPHRSAADYLLASPGLAQRVVPGSPRVLNEGSFLGGSDHAPLLAAFYLSEK